MLSSLMETITVAVSLPSIVAVASALVILWLVLRPRRGGPNAPPVVLSSPVVPIPLIGTAWEFGLSPVKMITRCVKEYGPVFTIPFGPKRMTILVGPEAQELFFKASDDVLSQQQVYDFMRPIFGPDVVYDATRKNRQVEFQHTANGLRVSRLKGYVGKIERETRLYLREHMDRDEGEIDLFHALSELTILTASRCLHGDDVRENMFKEVSELYHDLDQGLTPLTVFWPNAPTRVHRKRNEARQQMIQLFSKVIKERREGGGKTDGTDILSIYMDLKYKDGRQATDEQVTGLLIALLFAGQHTSCITATWTSLFIANHPDVLERILKEQEIVMGSRNGGGGGGGRDDAATASSSTDAAASLDYDKLQDMTFLHDCMRETLRLCPPLILLIRKAMRDADVTVTAKTKANPGTQKTTYRIPKDDMVAVSPSVGMRLPDVFPKPDEFDPDRYGPGREEHRIPFAYLGFGGGMHSCMGQNFAYLQVKTILSVLFRLYEFERIVPGMPEINFAAMVVGPKGDCRIRYKKRK